MAFENYYQEELAYLREMGEVFADAYPKLAPFLAQKGNDPDVERLLEGFAFIAGRIRQKLDDELPELTHGMHALLWPHLLRPMPAASILQFNPNTDMITEKTTVKKGVEVDSVDVDETKCRFRTSYNVSLYPMNVEDIKHVEEGPTSIIKVRIKLHGGALLQQIKLDTLRFYFHGDMQSSFSLYQYFFQYLSSVTVRAPDREYSEDRFELGPNAVHAVGFSDHEELYPYPENAFIGYRLIQEYFGLPHKFLFFDLKGLSRLANFKESEGFELVFRFERRINELVRVNKNSLLLYCTPIINLLKMQADPLRLTEEKVEHWVRPSSSKLSHYEVFSVDKVVGWVYGGRKSTVYMPFISFENGIDINMKDSNFYQLRVRPSVVGRSADVFMSFKSSNQHSSGANGTTISIDLTCTNCQLPEKLRVGDINVPTGTSPEFAEFRNILPATPSTPPPLEKDLPWQLISNMSLNYLSLANLSALRVILSTYNFPAYYNRQAARAHQLKMEGITSINLEPATTLFKGLPVRGYRTIVEMKSSNFSSEGEMYMFATILNEFLALYASVNSFNQLIVREVDRGDVFQWKAKVGQQPLL